MQAEATLFRSTLNAEVLAGEHAPRASDGAPEDGDSVDATSTKANDAPYLCPIRQTLDATREGRHKLSHTRK